MRFIPLRQRLAALPKLTLSSVLILLDISTAFDTVNHLLSPRAQF
jgi:hypothetical protein